MTNGRARQGVSLQCMESRDPASGLSPGKLSPRVRERILYKKKTHCPARVFPTSHRTHPLREIPMTMQQPGAGFGPARWVAVAAVLFSASTASAAGPWSAVINPDYSLSFSFLRENQSVFQVGLGGWGPQWAWVG